MPCVYLIFSSKAGKYYTGSSREDDATARLSRHNSSYVKSTKSGVPWVLIHSEFFPDYSSARKRELFLKSGKGRAWVNLNFPKK